MQTGQTVGRKLLGMEGEGIDRRGGRVEARAEGEARRGGGDTAFLGM